jgi:hypothetical protein
VAIEAHKCNQPGCKGFVVFENADFELKDIPTDEKYGCYAFDRPHCRECGKEFLVIPHYIVIEVKDKDLSDFEQLDSACITSYEKRQKERKYEAETDPSLRIMNFIEQRGYTYAVHDVLAEYSKYQELNCYLSHSMKDCISNLENEIKQILADGQL